MSKYKYIFINSFKEYVQDKYALVLLTISALIELVGFVYLYSYILNGNAGISNIILIYYLFIAMTGSFVSSRFGLELRNAILNENYLFINNLPINPFIYYLIRDLGRHWLTAVALHLIGVIILLTTNYPPLFIIPFLIFSFLASILSHLIYFLGMSIFFFFEGFDMWIIYIIVDFLNGALVPIFLFPQIFKSIFIYILPFGYASGVFAYFLSYKDFQGLTLAVFYSVIWTIVGYIFANKIWNKGSYYFQENS